MNNLGETMRDTWPNASIEIELAPWTWTWRPWAYLGDGMLGARWLFLTLQVNWLPRRMWRRR